MLYLFLIVIISLLITRLIQLRKTLKIYKELIQAPIEYAKQRPTGERGWKTWLEKVNKSIM